MTATIALPRADADRKPAAPPGVNHFHLNLNVADMDRAVGFYKVLFDREPFKHYPDYTEFVVDDPALVLALTKYPRTCGGPINHIGLRFTDLARLEALHARLEAAGLAPNRQGTVNCCYATGTKVWAVDPDHNLLELYVLRNDLPQFGYEEPPAQPEEKTGVTWEHRSPVELPDRVPHDDNSLDEVDLIGTLNAGHPAARINALLADVMRALKPGGRVRVQGMVGDVPFPGVPDFPGLASRVKSVPVEHEPAEVLAAAGFAGVHFDMHGDIKCIAAAGVQLRKVRLVGTKPRPDAAAGGHAVRYLGPFEAVELEAGRTFARGRTVPVPAGLWQQLKQGPAAGQFAFFVDDAT
jgi:SAM-dependent methyltransferase